MIQLGFSATRVAEEKAEYNGQMLKQVVGLKKTWVCKSVQPWTLGAKNEVPEDNATSLRVLLKDKETGFEAPGFCSVAKSATQDNYLDAFGTVDYTQWPGKEVVATYLASSTPGNAEFSFARYIKK